MISDHEGADRDNDGWDAYAIWRDFLQNNSVQNNPFGMIFDVEDYINDYYGYVANSPNDPLLHGAAGNVSNMEFHGSTAMSINTTDNPTVIGAVFQSGYSNTGTTHVMVAYAEYGEGRVVGLVDSSPPDDGSGQSGNDLYDGWNEKDNGTLITNATLWLAEENTAINNIKTSEIIFPNPSSNGIFNIQTKNTNKTKISVFDSNGKLITTKENNMQTNTIDISNAGSGLFFIKIETENSINWGKIIIK